MTRKSPCHIECHIGRQNALVFNIGVACLNCMILRMSLCFEMPEDYTKKRLLYPTSLIIMPFFLMASVDYIWSFSGRFFVKFGSSKKKSAIDSHLYVMLEQCMAHKNAQNTCIMTWREMCKCQNVQNKRAYRTNRFSQACQNHM